MHLRAKSRTHAVRDLAIEHGARVKNGPRVAERMFSTETDVKRRDGTVAVAERRGG